ncbi:hypothetical protein OPT61_g6581 [Boeremia exigua]|uniref:Uncharacterized protein n=1 Tax=Boeremia exigua TaxID=749465 RepID=A0ACC2I5N4_9PLEO|nr:hypothetical protein OPT61_g6581 [Boeremia exigua]
MPDTRELHLAHPVNRRLHVPRNQHLARLQPEPQRVVAPADVEVAPLPLEDAVRLLRVNGVRCPVDGERALDPRRWVCPVP